MDDKEKKKLFASVLKKAAGYRTTETVEEYSLCDGEMTLTKRKVTSKDVPPDITALKYLLGDYEEQKVSKEELDREREELIEMYFDEEEAGVNTEKD